MLMFNDFIYSCWLMRPFDLPSSYNRPSAIAMPLVAGWCNAGTRREHVAQIILATAERGCLNRSTFDNPKPVEFRALIGNLGCCGWDTLAPFHLGNTPFGCGPMQWGAVGHHHRNAGFIRQQPAPVAHLPDESGVPRGRGIAHW
jgi:hypothetical protein